MGDYYRGLLTAGGLIPRNTACPWAGRCRERKDRCPTRDHLLPHAFSCALARLACVAREPTDIALRSADDAR